MWGECQELYVHLCYVSMFHVSCYCFVRFSIRLCVKRPLFVSYSRVHARDRVRECRLQRQDGGAHASTLVYVNKGKKASFRRWCCSFQTFVRRNGAERVTYQGFNELCDRDIGWGQCGLLASSRFSDLSVSSPPVVSLCM